MLSHKFWIYYLAYYFFSATRNFVFSKTLEPSFWGRLYIRSSVHSIQYFRDKYGGPINETEEYELYFSKSNNLGCKKDLATFEKEQLLFQQNPMTYLVLDRGNCTFQEKSIYAEEMGAKGLVLISDTEDVVNPIAILPDNITINIPTIAIRHSGGVQLRRMAKYKSHLQMLLSPMYCTNTLPKKCTAQNETFINSYLKKNLVQGGYIISLNDQLKKHDFLAARFGGVFHSTLFSIRPLRPLRICSENEFQSLDYYGRFNGKAVLMSYSCDSNSKYDDDQNWNGLTDSGNYNENNYECPSFITKLHELEKVNATAAIIVLPDTNLSHAYTNEKWNFYNISMPILVVTNVTGEYLMEHENHIFQMQPDNKVALAWKELHDLEIWNHWPSKRNDRINLLIRLIQDNVQSASRMNRVESVFTTIIGGSIEEYQEVVNKVKEMKISNGFKESMIEEESEYNIASTTIHATEL